MGKRIKLTIQFGNNLWGGANILLGDLILRIGKEKYVIGVDRHFLNFWVYYLKIQEFNESLNVYQVALQKRVPSYTSKYI